MTQPDNSGEAVVNVIGIGAIAICGIIAFLNNYDDRKEVVTTKDAQIEQVKDERDRCRYEFEGYRNGRR